MTFSTACATLAVRGPSWRAEISTPFTRATSCWSARSAAAGPQPVSTAPPALRAHASASISVRIGEAPVRHPGGRGEAGDDQDPGAWPGDRRDGEARLERRGLRRDAHLRLRGAGKACLLRAGDDGEPVEVG